MAGLTIQQAAETAGWTPRMLRYIEQIGLVGAARTASGYRIYGPEQLQRLRTLRELLATHDIGLADVGFALRLREDPALRDAVEHWLAGQAIRPAHVPPTDWLTFEQQKHERLLQSIAAPQPPATRRPTTRAPAPAAPRRSAATDDPTITVHKETA